MLGALSLQLLYLLSEVSLVVFFTLYMHSTYYIWVDAVKGTSLKHLFFYPARVAASQAINVYTGISIEMSNGP